DEKVVMLAKVIEKYAPRSVECSVSRRDFDSILKPVAPYNLKTPYFASFYGVAVTVARLHHQTGIRIPVEFVFDEQEQLGLEVANWYHYVKCQQPAALQPLLGGAPQFADDKRVPA